MAVPDIWWVRLRVHTGERVILREYHITDRTYDLLKLNSNVTITACHPVKVPDMGELLKDWGSARS